MWFQLSLWGGKYDLGLNYILIYTLLPEIPYQCDHFHLPKLHCHFCWLHPKVVHFNKLLVGRHPLIYLCFDWCRKHLALRAMVLLVSVTRSLGTYPIVCGYWYDEDKQWSVAHWNLVDRASGNQGKWHVLNGFRGAVVAVWGTIKYLPCFFLRLLMLVSWCTDH